MERNLNKVGQRLSWLTMTPTPMAAGESESRGIRILLFILLHAVGLAFVLTSWAAVVYFFGTLLYRRAKDAGAPQTVKEFRWKLRNQDLTFDQMVRELMKVSDQDQADFERIKAELLQELAARNHQKQDDTDYWEYDRKREELRARYDPENKWNEATSVPADYLREVRALNIQYRNMLQRRNGFTASDFNDA